MIYNKTKCNITDLICRTPFQAAPTNGYLHMSTLTDFYMTSTQDFYIQSHINLWHTSGHCGPMLTMDRISKINDCPALQAEPTFDLLKSLEYIHGQPGHCISMYMYSQIHKYSYWVQCKPILYIECISNMNSSYLVAAAIKIVAVISSHWVPEITSLWPGPWFNIKMTSYQYSKSHCWDKTILRPSCLHNGISYTSKMSPLYWIWSLETPAGDAIWK